MPTTLTLKLTLRDTKPPIWRRLTVPAAYTFEDLHLTLQVVMGWHNSHLWSFWNEKRGAEAVRFDPIPPGQTAETWFEFPDQRDAATATVGEVLTAVGQKMLYTYDMGDNWEHSLLVEALDEAPADAPDVPKCLAGRRACPPEDCGGIPGYEELLLRLESKKRRRWSKSW